MADRIIPLAPGESVVVTGQKLTANPNAGRTRWRVTDGRPKPPPDPPPPTDYDETFVGKGSGNQGAELSAFIRANPGANLAVSGRVLVAGSINQPAVKVEGAGTRLTLLPGGALQCTAVSYGILEYQPSAVDQFWKGWEVIGDKYEWIGEEDPNGVEDGLSFRGAKRITFEDLVVHDTRGDAFYLASGADDIVAKNVRFYRNARNGLGHTAGKVTLVGGSIDQSGLHSLDMEPNNDADAATMFLTAYDLRLTRHDDLPIVAGKGYTIGGMWGGGRGGIKLGMDIQRCSAARFSVAVSNMQRMTFKGNASDQPVAGNTEALEFEHVGTKDPSSVAGFNSANTRIQNPSVYS